MLVVSRKVNETIMIGDTVKVVVVNIRGGKVRIGIDAPISTSVHREEVYAAIKREHGDIPTRRFTMVEGLLFCSQPMPGSLELAKVSPKGFPHYIGVTSDAAAKSIAQAFEGEFVELEEVQP